MVIPSSTSILNMVLMRYDFPNYGFCTRKREQKFFIDKSTGAVMLLLGIKLYWILKIMVYLCCKPL